MAKPVYLPRTICYITKKVDTSVAILESPEHALVLDALIYLSEFVDLGEDNLNFLQKCGVVSKLLNLLERNVPILKLALRLLGMLLATDDAMEEIDQELYDNKILKISDLCVTHQNDIVKQFSISVLSKLARSDRIVCLIFKIDLFYHILHTIRTTSHEELLESSLELFLKMLGVPAALDILPDIYGIDLSILMIDLDNGTKNTVRLVLEIIYELTYYCVDSIQRMFREATLLETMFDVVTDPSKEEYHETAFEIIINSMKSYETSDYFIETLQFLKFCQWVKTCEERYHYYCISILEQLTAIPSRRQILFDLSVEESILSLFRSTEKSVLNKTCIAVTNMASHKYCFEQMLKPAVLKDIFQILLRRDEEDHANEIALKTIVTFSRRDFTTLDLVYKFGVHKVLLGYFKKDDSFMSEESWIGIMEILNEMSVHPLHQHDIIGIGFIQKLLRLFAKATNTTATFASEVVANLVEFPEFRRIFLLLNGPGIYTEVLRHSQNIKLLRNAFYLIYTALEYEDVMQNFFRNGLVEILTDFPEDFKLQMPVTEKILRLIYNQNPSIKFFYTNKLRVTDKLGDKFHMIIGQWKGAFPFPEDLQKLPTSATCTAYVISDSFELKREDEEDTSGSTQSPTSISSEGAVSVVARISSNVSSHVRCMQISYGQLSPDPFLPMYIKHATTQCCQIEIMEQKIEFLAKYVNSILQEPAGGYVKADQMHGVTLHVELLKFKLGSNLVPIGFLRLGDHCEKALLFKAIADRCCIPTSLIKGKGKLYWNEVILFDREAGDNSLRMYVVDLMNQVGRLLPVGSRIANHYCNIEACADMKCERRSSKDVSV